MDVLLLDTETTGLDPKARLIQLAWKDLATGETFNELFKPDVQISIEAMATHHITEEDVVDKEPFANSEAKKKLQELANDRVVVCHNAKYDVSVLQREGVTIGRYACTYKVAYRMIDSPNYKLQYLRYFLKLQVDKSASAHDAMGDVLALEKLFEHLACLSTIEQMEEITRNPLILKKLDFGKYKDMDLKMLAGIDRGYLQWLERQEFANENEDLKYTINFYLSQK